MRLKGRGMQRADGNGTEGQIYTYNLNAMGTPKQSPTLTYLKPKPKDTPALVCPLVLPGFTFSHSQGWVAAVRPFGVKQWLRSQRSRIR